MINIAIFQPIVNTVIYCYWHCSPVIWAFNIFGCLCTFKNADASIRKRALELVFLLANYTDGKPLIKEFVDCLVVADPDFKKDLAAKIYSTVEKLVSNLFFLGFLLTYCTSNSVASLIGFLKRSYGTWIICSKFYPW